MKILITGATGFVGSNLINYLDSKKYEIIKLSRNKKIGFLKSGSINNKYNWENILKGCDVVIHLAGKAHIFKNPSENELKQINEVNYLGTINLAKQAAKFGVRKFIFLSSSKVNGEKTLNDSKFKETDKFIPTDPYAKSKYKAEYDLNKIALKNKMSVVIIRPPLIYGPGVKGNFLSLIKLVNLGMPLPFKSLKNKRAILSVKNLCDFIDCVIKDDRANNHTFLISDKRPITINNLVIKISKALNVNLKTFPLDKKLILFFATLIKKRKSITKITDSFELDISKSKKVLNWQPPYSTCKEIYSTINWYKKF